MAATPTSPPALHVRLAIWVSIIVILLISSAVRTYIRLQRALGKLAAISDSYPNPRALAADPTVAWRGGEHVIFCIVLI